MSSTLRTSSGQSVSLGQRLGRGGEGVVHELGGQDVANAAKLYLPGLSDSRKEKVEAMVAARFFAGSDLVAFPVEALYNSTDRSFAGFTMKKAAGFKPVHFMYSPASRRVAFPAADYRLLVRTAENIARAVARVHELGCVIGDLNQSGVLASANATVILIDTDSFQFAHEGRVYRCQVGVPEFTPPELQGRSLDLFRDRNHDAFGLAVLIFYLLFMGRHPFAGRFRQPGDMPMGRAIAEYRFAYSKIRDTGMDPPPHVPTLASLPQPLADAFERAFSSDGTGIVKRPTAVEWLGLLSNAEHQIIHCPREVTHYFFLGNSGCPWCAIERDIPGFRAFSPVSTPPKAPVAPPRRARGVRDWLAGSLVIALLLGVMGLLPSTQSTPATRCDSLGASAYDHQRPPGVAGVSLSALDAKAAVEACSEALKRDPSNIRIKFQLARAIQKAGDRPELAASLYHDAADASYAIAMNNYGVALQQGLLGLQIDKSEGLAWIKRAAEAGDPYGMRNYGQSFTDAKPPDLVTSTQWFRKSAEAGEPEAMVTYATDLRDGIGVAKSSSEAALWFRKAAEAGSAVGMNDLGVLLINDGVSADVQEAAIWFQKSAEAGTAVAMFNFGLMLRDGRGVDKSPSEAVSWFTKGAGAGNLDAMVALGLMLANGQGTPVDYNNGISWIRRAAKLGSSDATTVLHNNNISLDPDDQSQHDSNDRSGDAMSDEERQRNAPPCQMWDVWKHAYVPWHC